MKKFILLFLSFFIALPVFSASWVQIAEKTYLDIDSLTTYIDEYDSIKTNQKVYWLKELNDGSEYFKKIEKEYNTKIWYTMTQRLVNTNKKTNSIKTIISYDLKGNVVFSYTFPDFLLKWDSIVPNTYGEFLYDVVTHENDLRKLYEYQSNLRNK